jgi:hypothetical protein
MRADEINWLLQTTEGPKERIVREVGYGLSVEGASAAALVKAMQTAH